MTPFPSLPARPVAVEFHLIKPFLALRQLVDQSRVHGLDETDLLFWKCIWTSRIHQRTAEFWLYILEERKESNMQRSKSNELDKEVDKPNKLLGEALLNAIRLACARKSERH
jgi:hypothetical protein